MGRRHDDEDDDDEYLPDGVYHDDEPPLIPCPYCREPVPEEAQFCGRCENYISKEDSPADRKPLWVWVCLIAALGISLLTLF